jgi:chromosome partitioning protein
MEALLHTVELLQELGTEDYRILLTAVPSKPRKTGEMAREAMEGLPLFQQSIRRFVAYEKAALEGIPVYETGDANSKIAWREYEQVGKEILQ